MSGWRQTIPEQPDLLVSELSRVGVTTVANGTAPRISNEVGLPLRVAEVILAGDGSDFVRVGRLVDEERSYRIANRSNGSWVLPVDDGGPPGHRGSVDFSSLDRLYVAVEGDPVGL